MKIIFILIFLLINSIGCYTTQIERMEATGNYSVNYIVGFDHGEQSGKSAGGNIYSEFIKDVPMYANDEEYKIGWDDGYRKGKGASDWVNNFLNRGY